MRFSGDMLPAGKLSAGGREAKRGGQGAEVSGGRAGDLHARTHARMSIFRGEESTRDGDGLLV